MPAGLPGSGRPDGAAGLTDADLDAEAAAAARFAAEFYPADGVNYEWVVEYAKARSAAEHAVYRELDEKAAWILTYMGGGTGLLTLGSLAAVTSGQLSPWVVLAAAPSALCALRAIRSALDGRRTGLITYPTTVAERAWQKFATCWIACTQGRTTPTDGRTTSASAGSMLTVCEFGRGCTPAG